MVVSDELTNVQAAMLDSRDRLTASVAYVTTLTYAPTNNQWTQTLLNVYLVRLVLNCFTVHYYSFYVITRNILIVTNLMYSSHALFSFVFF